MLSQPEEKGWKWPCKAQPNLRTRGRKGFWKFWGKNNRLEVSTPKHKTQCQNFGRSKAQIRTERGWTFVLYAPQLYVPNITVFECPSHQQQHQRQMRQETEIVGKGTPVSRSTTASPPDKRRKTSIDPRGSATIPKSVDLSHQAQNEEECGWVGNTLELLQEVHMFHISCSPPSDF